MGTMMKTKTKMKMFPAAAAALAAALLATTASAGYAEGEPRTMLRKSGMEYAFGEIMLEFDVENELFAAWKTTHGKIYETEEEALYRRAIWRTSFALVQRHNSRRDVSYTLAMNEFADVTPTEFTQMYLMDAKASQGCSATARGEWTWSRENTLRLPESVDWRQKGIVSKVKNQGQCGSCWTFSTTGTLESHLALHKNKRVLLSEQQLIDCAGAYDNHGCSGGLPSQAFEYIHYNGGLETEDEYPYKGENGVSCAFNRSESAPGQVYGVVNVTAYDEDSLAAAVATRGPVAVAFEVMPDFRLYDSGVYQSQECGTRPHDVNHAVQAVGYGVEDGKPYWLIKNSWGPEWGDRGYFKMARGVNMCAVSTCCSFPIV